MAIPLLSLCIPTYNRADLLPTALESALAELAGCPEGLVELLVSDNGSEDATPSVLEAFRARYPALRVHRHPGNLGFDANYLSCVELAQGRFVWIMGDDDAWMPGSLGTLLKVLEQDPDAVLFAAMECDFEMRPLESRHWFEDPEAVPPLLRLGSPHELGAYFDNLRYQAGAFAFISAAVFRRERFLAAIASLGTACFGFHYLHLWGAMAMLRSPATLAWIREPLVYNRLGNDGLANTGPWGRGMHDLRVWRAVGEGVFGDDPMLKASFMAVLRRNHQDVMVRRMRFGAAGDAGRWQEAREHLLAVGFSPLWVEAVDLIYRLYLLEASLPARLDPKSLCIADVPLCVLGARRCCVLIPGGLEDLAAASGLLAALRASRRFDRMGVVCGPGCGDFLDGFEIQEVDSLRFAASRAEQDRLQGWIGDLAPNLLVNADRRRALAWDLVAARTQAPIALAYRGRPEGLSEELFHTLDRTYTLQVPPDAPWGALEEALGLSRADRRLWPSPIRCQEAASLLEDLAMDGASTLLVAGDDPEWFQEPAHLARIQARMETGARLLGIGNRGAYQTLDPILAPWGDRAVNLGENLEMSLVAGLIVQCGGVEGGGPLSLLASCLVGPPPSASSLPFQGNPDA
jgi:abequosyltransferase